MADVQRHTTLFFNLPNLFIYQAWHSLAWSQHGFWQPSFCIKQYLWRLFFMGELRWSFSALPQWIKRKVETCPFFILSVSWYFPFPSGKHRIEALPNSPNQIKGFLNYVFCRNWDVRNPAGTKLDSSSLINKQAVFLAPVRFIGLVWYFLGKFSYSIKTRMFKFFHINVSGTNWNNI